MYYWVQDPHGLCTLILTDLLPKQEVGSDEERVCLPTNLEQTQQLSFQIIILVRS